MRKWIFLGGLALTGVGAYAYYKKQIGILEDMTTKLSSIKILDKSSTLWRAEIVMTITNGSEIPFTITGWNIDVSINNEHVTRIVNNTEKFKISANGGTSPVRFIVSFNPQTLGLLDIVASILQKDKTRISFNGYVKAKSGIIRTKVPIEESYKLGDYI